jgi:DNA topoisomerase-2
MVNGMNVTELIDNQYKDYSKYVLYSRAIPHMIDGLKPSQRKILYTALKTAKNNRIKTASLSGNTISQGNYHHGDASLNEAITKMVQPFANNLPLLAGEGSFGSRLVPEAAAARYTYVRTHKNFEKYFADTMVTDSTIDPEDPEPAFYLPIIPWVLVNGIKGIAVGFATEIQPHNPKQLAKLCSLHLKKKDISKKELLPSFPGFNGTIEKINDEIFCFGVFKLKGQTKLHITEVPIGYSRESYVTLLDKLESDGKIVSYVDKCDASGFKFDITLKRVKSLNDNQIITMFKLKKKLNQNLTVIDHKGTLRVYDDTRKIIKDFCDYRVTKYTERYEYLVDKGSKDLRIIQAKIKFITQIISGQLDFTNKNKKQIRDELLTVKDIDNELVDILIRMPIYSLCQDELDKLEKEGVELYKKIKLWKKVDVTEQFIKELKVI